MIVSNRFKEHVVLLVVVALFTSVIVSAQEPGNKIALYDLSYILKMDMKNPVQVKEAWDHAHTVSTLQGVLNRNSPRLYINYVNYEGVDIDRYWWNKYRAKNKWLFGRDTLTYTNITDLISAFIPHIKGAVVYDPKIPATSNIASAVSGAEELIAVRFDEHPNSLYTRLILNGPKIPVKRWLVAQNGASIFLPGKTIPGTNRASTGSLKNDVYLWLIEHYLKKGKINTKYGAYYIDQLWMKKPNATNHNHHTLSNHDFFVSKNAFFFDLSPWGDERATDDPDQEPGRDLETLKELLLLAYGQNGAGSVFTHIGGFPPWAFKYTKRTGGKHGDVATEWEYSRVISAYNAFKDADAIGLGALANASFWQHYPLKKKYSQKWTSINELKQKGYVNEEGRLTIGNKNFFVFYVGDYDASSWLSQTTPGIWDDPNRGRVPLMWSISPVLAERVPMAMEYRRDTASPNDYFVAADNGAGYLMPGMLQAPRLISGLPDGLNSWVKHNQKYYKQWGLSVTGFIIDGNAPGLNKQGMDAYEKFSPNGIVPQKVPLTSLHGKMPVLRAGEDVNHNDPAEAASAILNDIKKRDIPFHWYRNILKSPTWYLKVVEELNRKDPNLVLLDAPTYFELYKMYLLEKNRR